MITYNNNYYYIIIIIIIIINFIIEKKDETEETETTLPLNLDDTKLLYSPYLPPINNNNNNNNSNSPKKRLSLTFKPFKRDPLKNPNFLEKKILLKEESIKNHKINILVNKYYY